MEDVQAQHGQGHHDALEGDEQVLALHDGAGPALAQLGDAEDAAEEEADGAEDEGGEEAAEAAGAAQAARRAVELGDGQAAGGDAGGAAVAAPGGAGEVGGEAEEDEQGGDLQGHAGEHDARAGLLVAAGLHGGAGHGAADGLQRERRRVGRDEAVRVPARPHERARRPERLDDAPQAHVDARRREGRPDGEADDLHDERHLGPAVAVALDPRRVPHHLAGGPEAHDGREEGRLPPALRPPRVDGDAEEAQEGEAEEGQKEDVGREDEFVHVEGEGGQLPEHFKAFDVVFQRVGGFKAFQGLEPVGPRIQGVRGRPGSPAHLGRRSSFDGAVPKMQYRPAGGRATELLSRTEGAGSGPTYI